MVFFCFSYQVPESVPEEVLIRTGTISVKDKFRHVEVATPSVLVEFDAIIVGSPTRFGSVASQMRAFWDLTGSIWKKSNLNFFWFLFLDYLLNSFFFFFFFFFGDSEQLVGKVASAFTTSAYQNGGQETTVLSMWTTFGHHGMIIVPNGYTSNEEEFEVVGGSPYGSGSGGNNKKRKKTKK